MNGIFKKYASAAFSTKMVIVLLIILFFSEHVYSGAEGRLILNVKDGKHWEHSFRVFFFINVTNQPQMSFWLEDSCGNYISTLYVTHRTAKQDWRPAPGENKEEIRRPSALPVWIHKHQDNVIMKPAACASCHNFLSREEKLAASNSVTDAITGATPESGFLKEFKIPEGLKPGVYIIKAEINHSMDFNNYYREEIAETDSAYNGGKMGSGQPSIVWAGKLVIDSGESMTALKIIGHGHPSGKNGHIFRDLDNLDTALDIVESINFVFKPY